MKYILYLRVSTDLQDLETQRVKCLSFIRAKEGRPFDYMLCTDKVSSRKPWAKREGLQQALHALDKGDMLVCLRADRLARSLYETTCIINMLDEKGADIILIDQPGIKNKVLLGLYAGMAEEEVKLIRKRIKEKMDAKKVRSERISRHLPYGYEMDKEVLVWVKGPDKTMIQKPGLLIPNQEEQVVVDLMCRWFDVGMSYREIASELKKLGYKNRRGSPFQSMSIYRILEKRGRTRSLDRLLEKKLEVMSHS